MEKSKMRMKSVASVLAAGAIAFGASAAFATPASADAIDDMWGAIDQGFKDAEDSLDELGKHSNTQIEDAVANAVTAPVDAIASVDVAAVAETLGNAAKAVDDALAKTPTDQQFAAADATVNQAIDDAYKLAGEVAAVADSALGQADVGKGAPDNAAGQVAAQIAPDKPAAVNKQPDQPAGVQAPAKASGVATSGDSGVQSGEAVVAAKPEVKPEVKPEIKPEVKPEVKVQSGKSAVAKAADHNGKLADTGVSVLVPAAVVGLALAGAGAVMVTRRRRTAQNEA